MSRNFEIFLLVIYGINMVMNIMSKDWMVANGWFCATLAQVRVLSLMRKD
jgi:hypothetical protein